jgi:TPR repeat protein
MYYHGYGKRRNLREAVKWIRKAAERGDDSAEFALGEFYSNGDGVLLDKAESYKWFKLASAQDRQDALEWLKKEQREFSPADQAEGERRAKAFVAKVEPDPDLKFSQFTN